MNVINILVIIAVVICALVSTVLFYLIVYHMSDYPLFVTNVNTTLAGISGITCLIINHFYYKYKLKSSSIYISKQQLLLSDEDTQSITLQQNEYSYLENILFVTLRNKRCLKYILLICCLYSLINTLQIYTIQMLTSKDSNLTVLIGEFTIPFSMLISYILYRNKYNYLNIIGSIIVIIGIGFAFSSGMAVSTNSTSITFLIIYLLSCIPQSFAMVITKYVLSPCSLLDTLNIDNIDHGIFKSFEFTVCENIIEIPFNILFGLIGTLFSNKINVFDDYYNGFLCIMMKNECNGYPLMLFLLFGPVVLMTIWTQSLLFQKNKNGVVLFLLIQSVCIPLSNVLLSSKLIMGYLAADSTDSIWYGFVIVPIGILVYAMGERKTFHQNKKFVMFLDDKASINSY